MKDMKGDLLECEILRKIYKGQNYWIGSLTVTDMKEDYLVL